MKNVKARVFIAKFRRRCNSNFLCEYVLCVTLKSCLEITSGVLEINATF